MARNPARAKNRAKQRRANDAAKINTTEVVIPVKVQHAPANGRMAGMAEIPVAMTHNSEVMPGSVIGKAEIPVTLTGADSRSKQRPLGTRRALTVVSVAGKRKRQAKPGSQQEDEYRPLPPLPPLRRPMAEPRDPLLRSLNAVIDVEETAVNIAGSLALAAIGAFETATRLLLRAPAAINRAREIGEEVVPWSLQEIEAELEDWPAMRSAA